MANTKGKIVHLIGQLGQGGAERQLIYLAGQLAARGWPQAVVSFGGGDVWGHHLETLKIPLYEVPRSPIKPWRLWQLGRILRRERPAIVHTWSHRPAQYLHWAWGKGDARLLYGVRLDLTIDSHTGDPVPHLGYISALARADCAVSNSQSALDNLARGGMKLPRAEVIYNIVECRGRANPAAPAATPRIVAVGSLIPRKCYDCLLRAAGILAAEHEPFELLLAGEGAERKSLESLASELRLEGRVRFLGASDNVADLLATAYILAHPSKREGLSNTILEGMAEGLPVVSTVECAAEIIEDGRTGLLVPAGQPAALADALRRLLHDAALRGRLGTAALRHVERCCNADVITEQYENVYRSLLAPATRLVAATTL